MSEWLSLEKLVRLLQSVDVLEPLPAEEVRTLAFGAALRRLSAGESMPLDPKTHAQQTLLLLEGRARLCEEGPPERTLTASVAEGGTMVGVTGLAARPGGLRLEALAPSLVCLVATEDFERLLMRNPGVGLSLLHILAERIVVLEGRLTDLAYRKVPARLAGTIVRLAEGEGIVTREGSSRIPTRYTHQQLASMIGANREAVTRAMRALREGGAIEVRGRRIHVVDQETLRREAEEG
ncbi:MAG: Crp/Fnr family transcriptional regulator [Actinomycetota bacterium]|nr:Crp/Fnr family transcriptional regulator [Actinomycetota bacterium]